MDSPRAPTGAVSSTQKVYRKLRRLVIAGTIDPGSRLKIDDLKERLQAGASPIREALSLLTSDQLVERIDQRGFRAAAVSRSHFTELLQLRRELEQLALRASIERGDADWHAALGRSADRLAESDRARPARWEVLHRHFHRTLIEACDSPILLRFCAQLYDLNIRYRNLAHRSADYGSRDVVDEHRAIVEAVLAGDSALACERLSTHYTLTGDYLFERLADVGIR